MKHTITTITSDSIANGATQEQVERKEVIKMRNNAERGFTLIELIFGLAIAAVAMIAGLHG
ncbi:MAG TPA: type II secretion system protein [Bryobacteraceae bacterium]|nr:type II secretion system protein [Bryobacteraceae bacterium]